MSMTGAGSDDADCEGRQMTDETLTLIEQLAEDLGIDPEFEHDTAGKALLRFVEEHGLTLVEQ